MLNRRFISSQSGTTLVLMALILPLLLIAMGMTIDMSRLYVVQAKAQSASDAALLGAVEVLLGCPDNSLYRRGS